MLPKLFFTIASITLIAGVLLNLHQKRLQTLHAMSDLHVQMDADRKATWDAQAKIAEGTHPVALAEAVARVGLDLEPLPTPQDEPAKPALWPSPTHFSHAPANVTNRE